MSTYIIVSETFRSIKTPKMKKFPEKSYGIKKIHLKIDIEQDKKVNN